MNYDELLAPAAKAMRPSGIRKFFDLAADMPHCISLGVGEPDFKTPWSVRDAGIRSLELGRTKYTANSGLKELRGEICNYLQRRFDLHYKEENVLVTVGGSEAIDLTIRAVVQPGDEVIIPEPCFVCYEPITQLTGGVPVHIATRAEDQFRLTADQLRAAITPRTKLLIFPYPNNPTGAVMSAAEMEEIAAVLRETNVLVLSDEIYSELTYGLDRHVSIASLPGMAERTIVVNGFSKSYAMTGWRIGAKEYEACDKGTKKAAIIGVITAAILETIFALASGTLMHLFTDDPAMISLVGKLLVIDIALESGRVTNLVYGQALKTSGDAIFPTIIGAIFMYLCMVGGTYFFGIHLGLLVVGAYIGMASDECVRAVCMYLRWKSGKWKSKGFL